MDMGQYSSSSHLLTPLLLLFVYFAPAVRIGNLVNKMKHSVEQTMYNSLALAGGRAVETRPAVILGISKDRASSILFA
jgi:hypothetical protein